MRIQDIDIIKGNTFVSGLTVHNADGTAANLTGLTGNRITFVLYDGDTVLKTLAIGTGITITAATDGEIEIVIEHADTSALALGHFTYEVTVTDLSEHKYSVTAGNARVMLARPTCVYCQPADVAAQLRLSDKNGRLVFTDATDPSYAEVQELIRRTEDHIDSYTEDAWRETACEQYYLTPQSHYMGWAMWENGTGLKHIGIKTLSKAAGDILEIRNGSTWTDLLDGTHEEGPGKDYWLDYEWGVLYLGRNMPFLSPWQVKLKYRYGHPIVPYDIKHACVLLAASEILINDFYSAVLPTIEGNQLNRYQTYEHWRDKAHDHMNRHRRHWSPLR